MTDDKFDLSRRKVLGSIGVIGAGSAAAGAGTMAYFSDEETGTDNRVKAGTIDLRTGGSNGFSRAVDASEVAPGDEETEYVPLNNAGSVDGDEIEIDVNHDSGSSALYQYLQLDIGVVRDVNSGDGEVTEGTRKRARRSSYSTVVSRGYAKTGAELSTEDSNKYLYINWKFRETGSEQNDAQGKSVSFNISVKLVQ